MNLGVFRALVVCEAMQEVHGVICFITYHLLMPIILAGGHASRQFRAAESSSGNGMNDAYTYLSIRSLLCGEVQLPQILMGCHC